MAMGTRKMRQRQEELWYGGELPTAPGHPFYKRLNDVVDPKIWTEKRLFLDGGRH